MSIVTLIMDMQNKYRNRTGREPKYIYIHPDSLEEIKREFLMREAFNGNPKNNIITVAGMEIRTSVLCPHDNIYCSEEELEA